MDRMFGSSVCVIAIGGPHFADSRAPATASWDPRSTRVATDSPPRFQNPPRPFSLESTRLHLSPTRPPLATLPLAPLLLTRERDIRPETVFQWRHRFVVSPSAALFSIFCTAAPIPRRAGGLYSAAAIQWASRATWNAAFNVESAPNGTRMPGATTCSATCFMPGLLAAGRQVTGNDLRRGL